MRSSTPLVAFLLAFACSNTAALPPEPPPPATVPPVVMPPVVMPPVVMPPAMMPPTVIPEGLRVEEWGTYTSVQASDGHPLGGVHHEDERLPAWVHRRDLGAGGYYLEQLPEEPLEQLETPVLYFWSKEATPVEVTVQFPRGVVSQWYPEAQQYAPALHTMTALAGGAMTWQLTVDPALDPASLQAVDPNEIWAPSRHVASAPVRWTAPDGTDEREQFIFYRGLGTFAPPIQVLASDEQLRIGNQSRDTPARAFVLQVTGDRGRIVPIGPLAPGVTAAAIPAAADTLDAYVASARTLLAGALVESGLHADVAQAMVDTWTRSWFRNQGLRVLYLAPRSWTDAWLPTTIAPTPVSFVRTLVGRIEVLTPREEQALVARVKSGVRSQAALDVSSLGRFAEPRLLRAIEQLTARDEVEYARGYQLTAHQDR
jgi:hypothetical protein